MDPQSIQALIASLNAQIEKIKDVVPSPIVLTSPIVRIYFKKLVDQFIPNVTVLGFCEIAQGNSKTECITVKHLFRILKGGV